MRESKTTTNLLMVSMERTMGEQASESNLKLIGTNAQRASKPAKVT
jgi:hypothetical protein